MFGALIEDGYTEPGYIAKRENLYPEVRFKYRPIGVERRATLSDMADALSKDEQEVVAAGELAKAIVSWDVKNSKGESIEPSKSNLLALKPGLFQTLYAIVSGVVACDTDPKWAAEDKLKHAELKLAALDQKTDVGSARELADAKN